MTMSTMTPSRKRPPQLQAVSVPTSDLKPEDLVNSLPIAMAIFRRVAGGEPVISFANCAFEDFAGYSRHAALGLTPDRVNGFDASINLAERIRTALATGQQAHFDVAPVSAQSVRLHACTLYPIASPSGPCDHVFATILDVTSEKLAQKQMVQAAYHDELTGLPNRLLFLDKIEESVSRLQSAGAAHATAIMSLNLDRFQLVNESLGHSAGDQLLTALSLRLMKALRVGDTLARLSGDEFAVLMDGIDSLEEALVVAGRISLEMRAPFHISGLDLHMSISIGVASTLDGSAHPEDLMRNADFAMHRAKALGKARTEVYHPDLHGRARNLFQLEGELRRAIDANQLALHYQPLLDLSTGAVIGFEALARWPHETRGMVSPAEFIPIAEETGLVVPLGRWALRAACRQLRVWRDTFGDAAKDLSMAVNVSSIQFARDSLVDVVTEALVDNGLPGAVLTLELTESAIVENPERTKAILQQLKGLDVEIAIDDFGTGYSSLAHLQRFPIDKIKLDRTFINQMTESPSNRKLTEALLMLARSLDKSVVAEGIETDHQRQMLKDLKCQFGQGFLFSKPLDTETASEFLRARLAIV
jgi:diguanylate cyclase (GGDEF)-like protein